MTHLGESTVIPNISMMRETIADETKFPLFDILFDRIESFFFGNLHLGVGPSRNFDDHVEDTGILISKERNVVEGRNGNAVLFQINAMF